MLPSFICVAKTSIPLYLVSFSPRLIQKTLKKFFKGSLAAISLFLSLSRDIIVAPGDVEIFTLIKNWSLKFLSETNAVATAQWIHMRLASCGPRFES